MENQPAELQTIPQQAEMTVVKTPEQYMANTVIGQNAAEMANILRRTVENVEKDPNYIPQAQAIKQAVDGMIDLAKTEVAMMVAVNNIQKAH